MTPLRRDTLLFLGLLSARLLFVQSIKPEKEYDQFSEGLSKAFPDSGVTILSLTQAPAVVIPPPLPFGSDYAGPSTSQAEEDPPSGLEILVAVFFFVAAAWLLVAVFYALLALVVLRMRAQGRLDLDEENFGRFYVFGNRAYIPLGCILRRYVVAFNVDRQSGSSRRGTHRYISRSERRDAVEGILMGLGKDSDKSPKQANGNVDEELGRGTIYQNDLMATSSQSKSTKQCVPKEEVEEPSEEEAVCSICLVEYGPDDGIFNSKICDHIFHKGCILDWLERRSNTDCPCCRQPLVSDLEVWEEVKKQRKLSGKKKKKAEQQHGWFATSRTFDRRERSRTDETAIDVDADTGHLYVHQRHDTMLTLPEVFDSFTANHGNDVSSSVASDDSTDDSGALALASDEETASFSDLNMENNRSGRENDLHRSPDTSEGDSCSVASIVESDAPFDERHEDSTRCDDVSRQDEILEQNQRSTEEDLVAARNRSDTDPTGL